MTDITRCGVCAAGGPCDEHYDYISEYSSEHVEENSTHTKCKVCNALFVHRLIDDEGHCAKCAQIFCVICNEPFLNARGLTKSCHCKEAED